MFSTYLAEMTTKWGFNDGELIPNDVPAARVVIVEAGREWLKKHQPELTIDLYDRPGFHNPYFVHFHPVNDPEKWEEVPDGFAAFLAEQLDEHFHYLVTTRTRLAPAGQRRRMIAAALEASS